MNIYAVILGISFSLFGPAPVEPAQQVYNNVEFQFALPIPAGSFLCPNDAGVVDHGPILALDGSARSCVDTSPGRFIEIVASYAIEEKPVALSVRLREECREVGHGKCVAGYSDLYINNLATLAGQINHSDGHIDIFIVAEHASNAGHSTLIDYSIRLHTTRKSLEEDVNTFRLLLHTIEFPTERR